MDFFVIQTCITDRIGDLACLNLGYCLFHFLRVFLCRFFRNKADHGSDSLRNRLCRDNNDLFILCQIAGLICSKDNIFIIRENINGFRIYLCNGIQHVLCTWVHGLSALNKVIHTQLTEDLCKSAACRNCNKAVSLWRLCLCLRFCKLFRILDQSFLMLFSHIVNLHSGKSAIGQSTFNSLSRMIGMHMHFNDLIVCNQNNGITNRGKEFFKLMLLFL